MATLEYEPLDGNTNSFRVLRIAPSNSFGRSPVVCKLEAAVWDTCEYEALSYSWGNHKHRSSILLHGEPFSVTKDLGVALEQLCLPDRVRTIWVDAICINQLDADERAAQVQKMGHIYRAAERVLVWVGPAKPVTELAFQQVERLYKCIDGSSKEAVDASSEEIEEIWKEDEPEEGSWVECLDEIIQRPYWSRAWTVQEVVLARDAILYCGPYTTPFFDLAEVLIHDVTRKYVNVTYGLYSYLNQTFALREKPEDPPSGLFGLAYAFRHRLVSEKPDKLYAFIGLLKSPSSSIPGGTFTIDYRQKPKALWMAISKETMSHHKTLLPLAMAQRDTNLMDASWCFNWSQHFRDPNDILEDQQLFWSGGLDDGGYYPLQGTVFSAADGLPARIQTDLQAPSVISVQGFTYGEVVAVGDSVFSASWGRPNYVQLFEKWESLVGGPWEEEQGDMARKFALTITGGAWTEEPLDWRAWNTRDCSQRVWDWKYWWYAETDDGTATSKGYKIRRHLDSEPHEQAERYARARDHACEGRRMFVLGGGKGFGLGTHTLGIGDRVVVLLGCDVPIVLHRRNWKRWRQIVDIEDKAKHYGSTWKVRGQAYVHDIMHYQGDLAADIKRGKVELEEFLVD
ncbi:HET-domain-containing protein [Sodiomyces alkalinus F11]|uniref:HET-domain-containing protein n=1 Tax=Sodiomyces alkalinus (strain CBS 110278 / VKM F-3762 / F11) TaxID=1314773 RepID=A0A3N2PVA7_SODAK|nr:HET-domain-containing protein [Sodiomyces alkalinus F11]ROT38429.1 HET-domain-containing protein [Sodiomyces alkalinus F11]